MERRCDNRIKFSGVLQLLSIYFSIRVMILTDVLHDDCCQGLSRCPLGSIKKHYFSQFIAAKKGWIFAKLTFPRCISKGFFPPIYFSSQYISKGFFSTDFFPAMHFHGCPPLFPLHHDRFRLSWELSLVSQHLCQILARF